MEDLAFSSFRKLFGLIYDLYQMKLHFDLPHRLSRLIFHSVVVNAVHKSYLDYL